MTLFQEGLCLPLGSTEKVRLDSILNKLGLEEDFKKYIATTSRSSLALGLEHCKKNPTFGR